jgi:hypothetical protein
MMARGCNRHIRPPHRPECRSPVSGGTGRHSEGKKFFFEKKNQKTFVSRRALSE